MKFKRLTNEDFEIEERFLTPDLRTTKFKKHVTDKKQLKYRTELDYENGADKLANTKQDYKNIVGYTSKDDKGRLAYVKYNNATEEYVVYFRNKQGEPLIISYYTRPRREFTGKKALEYFDELPDTE
jgi:hypothetical protein